MNFLKTIIIGLSSILLLTNCETTPNTEQSISTDIIRISGKTMGTTYNITYQDSNKVDYKPFIDSLLKAINQEVSTYIPDSDISIFNQKTETSFTFSVAEKPHLATNLIQSRTIFQQTNGKFDPTVMPLVNYWGFGYTEKKAISDVDSAKIKTILESVGLDKIEIASKGLDMVITKPNSKTQLDFSAIAKGYAVDAVGSFLASKDIKNFFVEIGGETVCKGKSPRGDLWTLGISRPSKDAAVTEFEEIIKLTDKGLATSGNYRNYHTSKDGSIYAHTINPTTGFPEKSTLLSTTVIADNCMIADAFATAFMVMGKDAAIELADKISSIEILLIFGDDEGKLETFTSEGFKVFIADNQ